MSENSTLLRAALTKLVKPLIRILLRHGVTFDEFVEVLRKSYVLVADQEFAPPGRKQSLSNIALVTGIHRHEVKKLMNSTNQKTPETLGYHRAARVINGWVTDPEFSDNGVARHLNIDTQFKQLVAKHSGDVTPRPILDELLRVGSIEKVDAKTVRLIVPAYIPRKSDEGLIEIFGDSVSDLITTIDHNLEANPSERRLQISVVHNNLPDDVLSDLELVSRDKSLEFLHDINRFFETQDRDSNPNVQGEGRNRAGIGLYFFQNKMDDE